MSEANFEVTGQHSTKVYIWHQYGLFCGILVSLAKQ